MPYDWIEEAVVCTHSVSIRHCRLPAEQVLWLVIALALYRHKSIGEVLDDLGLAVPSAQAPFVSKSAAAQARQRLGPEPLQWLFERSARAWCEQDQRAYLFKGLQLFAVDGTTLRTHEHDGNPRALVVKCEQTEVSFIRAFQPSRAHMASSPHRCSTCLKGWLASSMMTGQSRPNLSVMPFASSRNHLY